jgi:hypothetical protein
LRTSINSKKNKYTKLRVFRNLNKNIKAIIKMSVPNTLCVKLLKLKETVRSVENKMQFRVLILSASRK